SDAEERAAVHDARRKPRLLAARLLARRELQARFVVAAFRAHRTEMVRAVSPRDRKRVARHRRCAAALARRSRSRCPRGREGPLFASARGGPDGREAARRAMGEAGGSRALGSRRYRSYATSPWKIGSQAARVDPGMPRITRSAPASRSAPT